MCAAMTMASASQVKEHRPPPHRQPTTNSTTNYHLQMHRACLAYPIGSGSRLCRWPLNRQRDLQPNGGDGRMREHGNHNMGSDGAGADPPAPDTVPPATDTSDAIRRFRYKMAGIQLLRCICTRGGRGEKKKPLALHCCGRFSFSQGINQPAAYHQYQPPTGSADITEVRERRASYCCCNAVTNRIPRWGEGPEETSMT